MGKGLSRAARTLLQVGAVAAIVALLKAFTHLTDDQTTAIAGALLVLLSFLQAWGEEATGVALFEPARVQDPTDVVQQGGS